MTTNRTTNLTGTIHDAIDEVTTTIEGIHQSIARLPLDVLATVTPPLENTLADIRTVQQRSIGAVYGLVRDVNARVRRLTGASLSA